MDGPTPEERAGGVPDPDDGPERTRGLTLETCYRHAQVITGVHCTRCGRPICTDCMNEAPVGYQCPECLREAGRTGPRRRLVVSRGRPGQVVILLIAANVLMFLLTVGLGGAGSFATGGRRLFALGAMHPLAVAAGQWWRLLTAMFLHAGLLHLALNMYGVYLFGTLIEQTFGVLRFVAIYVVCGFLASVASFLFSDPQVPSVGASGALFGLLGAWVAYNYRRRTSALAYANLQWAGMLLVINLVLGFSIPGIDNFAHLGGLVAGVAAGAVAEGFGPRSTRTLVRVGGFAALTVLGIGLTMWRVSVLQASFFFG
jgi:membrane associated rhomboid family serine protease